MEKVLCERLFDNQVWKIILNDPKGNVVDSVMLKEFQEVLDDASKESHCKVLMFQGAGKHFSFGVSVEEHTEELAAQMLKSFHGLFIRLSELAIPTCSLINRSKPPALPGRQVELDNSGNIIKPPKGELLKAH